jgi:hypothetical protein
MAKAKFSTEVTINVPAAEVGRFLLDFVNYAKIHPLIVAIEPARARPEHVQSAADERLSPSPRHYQVTDRLKWGPLSFHVRYKVSMTQAGAQALHFEVWQRPAVYLDNYTSWTSLAQGRTLLREQVSVNAPCVLLPLVLHTAQTSHKQSFANLKAFLEREHGRGGAAD